MEKNIINKVTEKELLVSIYEEVLSLKETIKYIPNYISLSDVSSFHELSYKQLYKRVVESGDFEPDVHYKKDNGELKVSKNILHLLKRKRKPKSTKGGEKK